ncbi:hypothetical protein DFS34DRAFT_683816 [Phlyctochytrium arcticum]|nr:hypothetical protein DFS34DRAFT_683816 [Phlyctochytrium arcticum]
MAPTDKISIGIINFSKWMALSIYSYEHQVWDEDGETPEACKYKLFLSTIIDMLNTTAESHSDVVTRERWVYCMFTLELLLDSVMKRLQELQENDVYDTDLANLNEFLYILMTVGKSRSAAWNIELWKLDTL